MDSHGKGDLAEALVIARLKRQEIPVSLPFGDDERYDAVIETADGDVLTIQSKTGRLSNGKVEFHGRSRHTNSAGNVYKTDDGDVGYFIVHCHELDAMYVIAEDEVGTSISLRVDGPRPKDRSTEWAGSYEFDKRRSTGDVMENCISRPEHDT